MKILKDKQITREQAKQLPEGTNYAIYNPLTNSFKIEIANKNDIAHLKYAYDGLIYLEVKEDEE